MAEERKKGFPRIPRGVWFALRDKMKQKVPVEISPSYVSSALGMDPKSASANVLPALKAFGLIEESGRPSERAYDWRDDAKYAEVCQQIIEEVYPQELRDLFHSPDVSQESVRSWFARTARVGDAAATKFAITYLMLLDADLDKAKSAPTPKNQAPATGKIRKIFKPAAVKGSGSAVLVEPPTEDHRGDVGSGRGSSVTPKLHIDIQIHISPDSSAEQIDKIFASMAKHLKDFKS